MPDTITQSRLKTATVSWLASFRWHFAVTLSWNRTVGMDRARHDLSSLIKRVDRSLVGSHYHRLHSTKRTEAVFFFEGVEHDHVHVHSLWKAPQGRWFDLCKHFPGQRGGTWNDIVETGTYDVDFCTSIGSNSEIVGYVLKQQHRFSDAHTMVWASEFHRSR